MKTWAGIVKCQIIKTGPVDHVGEGGDNSVFVSDVLVRLWSDKSPHNDTDGPYGNNGPPHHTAIKQ